MSEFRMSRLRERRDEFHREVDRRLSEARPDRYTASVAEVDESGNVVREWEHPEARWLRPVAEEVVEDLGLTTHDLIRFRALDLMDEGLSRAEIEAKLHDETGAALLGDIGP